MNYSYQLPALATDFYKTGHIKQYPDNTEFVYSNLTARSAAHANMGPLFDDKVVFYGLQGFIREFIINLWDTRFFQEDVDTAIYDFQQIADSCLGPGSVSSEHLEKLHAVGYLPLTIQAVPEGSRVNLRVPMLTIINTHADFGWLTNYIETLLSCELWKPITVATIAYQYRKQLNHWVEKTGSSKEFADWQNHDFSMRGMSGLHDAAVCGSAFLLSSKGTDTIPAIGYISDFYYGGGDEGGSVPATEHSVMCMGGVDDEVGTIERLITKVYPQGIVSVVSDTWDFWNVITNTATLLKSQIMARDGKVVFRPDSGDPVLILCGDPSAPEGTPAHRGAVECLWDIFGGTTTDKGYRTLDSHVGLIYGDSITLDRQWQILERLAAKGFSAGNVVFGVGSYTFQYITRDTFGMAIKATWGQVGGVPRELFKDPKTGDGIKKSAKGLLKVTKEGNDYVLHDQQTYMQHLGGDLSVVYSNGTLESPVTYSTIRETLNAKEA